MTTDLGTPRVLPADEAEAELAVRTKLRARAGALLGAQAERGLPYLGLLLSVKLDPDVERELLSLSADELAERVQEAFVAWAEALASNGPLILAVDDLHWVYGVGFRGIVRPQILAFVDVGRGSEGISVFTGIDYPF